MSKESPVSAGNDAYVDLDRQVPGFALFLYPILSLKNHFLIKLHFPTFNSPASFLLSLPNPCF